LSADGLLSVDVRCVEQIMG